MLQERSSGTYEMELGNGIGGRLNGNEGMEMRRGNEAVPQLLLLFESTIVNRSCLYPLARTFREARD